jgi:hypothetical protein
VHNAGIGLGIAGAAFGTLGVSAAVFGDIRVAFGWSVVAAALFIVLAIAGALLSPERSMGTAAFLLFGCVSVMAAEVNDVSSWLGDALAAANGSVVTYVWHGQTFTPTAAEILFGSAGMLGFFGAGAFFFLGGLLALAQAMQHVPRRSSATT